MITESIKNLIEQEIANGFISKVKHPSADLFILNYTPKCTYNGHWNSITMTCRGLIVDSDYTIISRPFEKFFNINEVEETYEHRLPLELPKLYEKLDGSLGISYRLDGQLYIATRGRFDSKPAIIANQFLNKYDRSLFNPNWTYLFEIICKENDFNIVSYHFEDLILLAVRDTQSGTYLDYVSEAKRIGLKYAKHYSMQSITKLIEFLKRQKATDFEGFVLHYQEADLRIKIKNPNYLKIAQIFNNLSDENIQSFIIDCLANNTLDDLKSLLSNDLPFLTKIISFENLFTKKFYNLLLEINCIYELELNKLATRKEQAELILSKYGSIKGLLFLRLDLKMEKLTAGIWNYIKETSKGDIK